MNDALYVAASGMHTVERMLEVTAHNAVNNASPGFQRHEIIAQAFGSFLDDAMGRERLIGGEEVVVFDQGELRHSDHPYALALMGKGFFQVRDQDNEFHYTRNGQFTLDTQGRIASPRGYLLQGEGGPIQVDPAGGDVRIEPSGAVIQNGEEVGRVTVYDFEKGDRAKLEQSGETFFRAPDDVRPFVAEATEVRQGQMEFPAFGMKSTVKMLMASKSYDAMQRTIRTIDEVQQQVIRAIQ